MNVVLQALMHVTPLRDYFIFHSQPSKKAVPGAAAGQSASAFEVDGRSELVKRFGSLTRRLWNSRNFKAQVSPHEFLQEVSSASNKKFKTTEEGDPLEFLSWLLNALHRDLGGTRKANSSTRPPRSTTLKELSCALQALYTPSSRANCALRIKLFSSSRTSRVSSGQSSIWDEVGPKSCLHNQVTDAWIRRDQGDQIALPLLSYRSTSYTCLPGLDGAQQHYSASANIDCLGQIRRPYNTRNSRKAAKVQAYSFATIRDPPYQTLYGKQLCRGEEPDNHQLPVERRRNARL